MAIDGLNRRRVLLAAAALPLARPVLAASRPVLLASGRDADGFAAFGLDARGAILWRRALPGRAHGFALAPDRRRAVIFARRPGAWALPLDPGSGAAGPAWSAGGYALCGHGQFAAGGLVAATATDAEGEGHLLLFDARTGRRAGAWPTGGADPHEVLRIAADAFVVANGGDAADASSLVRMDDRTGRRLARAGAAPDLARLSLRHLAVLDGAAVVVCQDRSQPDPSVPLVAAWRDDGLDWLDLGPGIATMRGYCGSVASRGAALCVTSPNGGVAVEWPSRAAHAIADVCGVAALGDGFVLSSGGGEVILPGGGLRRHAVQWDNHMVAL
jgi:hypothetical protein